jgi:RHS repeat-associated protein
MQHVASLLRTLSCPSVNFRCSKFKWRRLLANALSVLLVWQSATLPLAATSEVRPPADKAAMPATSKSAVSKPASAQQTGIVLTPITTAFNSHVGVAYHQANNKLVLSANAAAAGQPRNFELIAADGSHAAYSNVAGLGGELKIATARDDGQGVSRGGFNVGELFFGTLVAGVIARLGANGATIENPWVILPNEGGTVSGLYLDRTDVFGGHVIAVTTTGKVWRVTAQRQATLVANLNTPLAGVTTLLNNVDRYGPWAGKILVGAPQTGTVYAVDAQGNNTAHQFGIIPSELRVIPAHENFYGVDATGQKLWGAPDDAFTGMLGDVLVAQAAPGKLGRLHWNGGAFEFALLAEVASWKQVTFAPAGAAPIADTGRFYEQIALVRRGMIFNSGRIEGALWQLTPEATMLNGSAVITSDLLVPGTPTVVRNGSPQLTGTLDGPGNPQPTNYQITLNGTPSVRYIVRRVDPIAMPSVTAPPAPTGNRDVQLNNSNTNPGNWATVRNLDINGSIGPVTVLPGTYGNFTINGNNVMVLGVAGASAPSTYNLQSLMVNGASEVRVVGPIALSVNNAVTINGGSCGTASNPSQLQLNLFQGNLVLNGNSVLYGVVRAPNNRVTLTGNTRLRGTVACDRLEVNGSSILQLTDTVVPAPPVNRAPTVNAGADQTITLPTNSVNLQGAASDDGLPQGTTLTYQWSRVSGPGPATFSAATSLMTTASFTQAGNYVLRLTASDTLLTSYDELAVTVVPQNQAPTANAGADQTISLPTDTVTLQGMASDDGLPSGVPLNYTWAKLSGPGNVVFGSANNATTTASFSTNGAYVLRLTVSDSELSGTDHVTIFVNRAPQVNAGPDQTITLPTTTVSLQGTVSDDGLPPGGVLSYTWTKVNGPGTVTFSAPNATATNATFSQAGNYTLRLMAADSLASGSDDVNVTVNAQNQPPTVNAGADQTLTWPTNSVSLQGTASDDGLPAGSSLSYTWARASGPGTVTFSNPNSSNTTATFSVGGVYTLRLTVSDTALSGSDEVNITVNQKPTVNAGADQVITLPTTSLSLTGTATDDGLPQGATLSYSWSRVSGPDNVTFSNPTALTTTATFSAGGVYTLRLSASDTLAIGSDDVVVTVNAAPTVNAGADQLINLPTNSTNLTGSVSDDGLPQGGGVSVSWSKLGGPGTVTFANANSAPTTVTFSTGGVYTLRLTASDTTASRSDDVIITVNQAPVVNAGPDMTIALPTNSVPLQGTATDDGLPSGPLSYTWTKLSGPGPVTFGNASNPVTTATFASAGVYVLRLTVSDGAAAGSDDVMITVNSGNQPPVVNAGPDRVILRPPYFILNVQGTVTDDGLPAGGALTVAWTKVSGPGQVFFSSPNTLTTHVSFIGTGVYVLRLTASDSQLSASDDLVVSVNGAPVVAAGPGQLIPTTTTTVNLNGSATDDGLPAGATLSYTWSKVSGPGTVTFGNPNSAATTATFSQPGTYVLELRVTDSVLTGSALLIIANTNQPPVVDAGPNVNLVWPNEDTAFLNASTSDADTPEDYELQFKWTQVSGPAGAVIQFPEDESTDVSFSAPGIYTFRLSVYDGLVTVSDEVTVNVTQSNGNRAPQLSSTATPEVINWPSNTIALQGTVTDDGLPLGSTLTYAWSKARGPAAVSFSAPNSLSTNVNFSLTGRYVLRLAASDGQYVSESDVFVVVNLPPTVDAGADRSIFLPAGGTVITTLQGTGVDDGLPTFNFYRWTLLGGSAEVSFVTNNIDYSHILNPAVTFSALGVYLLQLTGTDTTTTASDTVTITVLPRNQAPTVDAGADRAITLPINNLALIGVASDDGLPVGTSLTINWSKVSGPGTVSFGNAQTLITSASFSMAGTYTLRLTANDSEFAISDDVVITVNATNQAPIVSAGPDQQLAPLPNTLALNGSVTDDGVPVGAPLTVTWSQVSGPAPVVFNPSNTPVTNVTFSAQGTYVLRLTANDTQFSASDDVQVTVGCGANPVKLDIALVLDKSGSMTGQPFIDSKAAAKAFLDRLQLSTNDQIAIVSFGNPAEVNQPLTHNGAQAKAVIDGLAIDSFSGSNIDSGISVAMQELLSARHDPAAQRIIVLLSDGGYNHGPPPTHSAALAKAAGIRILSIGFGLPQYFNVVAMRDVASAPSDFFYAPSSSDLALAYGYLTASLCRNLPPIANAGPDFNVFQPATATLIGAASDDGVPSAASLSTQWSQVSGPAPATLLAPTQLTTTALFPQTGTYVFRLTVTDSFLTATDEVTVTVLSEPSLQGATLTLATTNATTNQVGTPVTAVATLKNASNQPIPNFGMRINLSGANVGNGSTATGLTNAAGQFSFSYTGTNSGSDLLTATAQGTGQSLNSNSLNFNWTVTTQIPTITQGWLAAPLHQSQVSDIIPITLSEAVTLTQGTLNVCGQVSTVSPSAPAESNGELRNNGNEEQAGEATRGPAANSASTLAPRIIGQLDPTQMPNGKCIVSLDGTNSNGERLVSQVLVHLVGENKPGRVTLRVNEFVVPAAGFPLTITRKYDSLEHNINGDFGYGWSLDVYATRLEVAPDHSVTFTDPASGRRVHFAFTPQSYGGLVGFLYQPAYTAEAGFYGTLTAESCGLVGLSQGQWTCIFSAGYQPTNFTYTDPYGRKFVMGVNGQLRSMTDLSGNTLTVTPTGITSNTGLSVPFVRDAQGRITQITDTASKLYKYNYDAAGNLANVELPTLPTRPSYTYNATHHLLTAKDARGNTEATLTYHTDGRLATVTDAVSNTTSFSYDLVNHTTTKTNPDTGTEITRTDAYGLLLSRTNPLNQTTTFSYDSQRNLVTEINAINQTQRYTYDSRGNRISATDPANQTVTASYNQYGAPTSLTDPLGNAVSIAYDAQGMPKELRDGVGIAAQLSYDSRGSLVSQTDGTGATRGYTYDQYGNKVVETNGLSRTQQWTYDSMGRPTQHQTARAGVVRNYTYDALGRLTLYREALGYQMTYEYDGNGNRTAMIDGLNRRTTYTYDAANRLMRVDYPDSTFVTYSYNFRGQRLTATDQNNRTTNYTYDKAGQLTKVTHPNGDFTTTTYDDIGRVRTRTDERNNMTTYEYDPGCACSGRVTKVIDALNHTTQSKFDAAGRLVSSIDAKGRETKYQYDARGRLIRTIAPDNTATSAVYDAAGRVIRRLDQASKTTQYGYDAAGNLTSVTDPLNQTTRYDYDQNNNLVGITDARSSGFGNRTTFEYNLRDQRSKRILPFASASEQYSYDVLGNLKTKTGFNNKVTTYNYDSLNRLTSIVPDASLSEPTLSFTYKPNGQRATMTDATGATVYNYDSRNRLTSKQTPFGTLTYTYNATNNVASAQSSNVNGLSVSYGYDALNRLQAVTDNRLAPGVTNYIYDEVGNLARTTQPNGVQHDYSYNSVDLLTQLNISKGAGTLERYNYTHTATRLRASMTELNGRTVNYTYDEAYQLLGEAITNAPQATQNGVIGYVLDAVGNRRQRNSTLPAITSTANTYDELNRLNTDSYDANGNTIAADGKTFGYDFRDKLKSVNGGAITIKYDGDGNRVSKTVGGVTTNYLVDTNNPTGYAQVVEEIVGGQVQRVYTYGNALVSQRQLVGGNWVTSHYGYDGSENVRYLTDSAGAVTDTFDYDAFGNLIGRTGTTPNNYLYRGQQFDADLGLYYNRARYYSPGRGRFLTMDMFEGATGEPRSLHKYLYSHADPVNLSDPSGFATLQSKTHLSSKIVTPASGAIGPGAVSTLPRVVIAGLASRYLNAAISCAIFALASYADIQGYSARTLFETACAAAPAVIAIVGGLASQETKNDDDDDGEEYYFRGTSVGYAGNESLQRLGLTPSSTDPLVATLFAVESSNYGSGVVYIASSQDLSGVGKDHSNVLGELEMEVVWRIQPLEFARRASISVDVSRAKSILYSMGFSVPGQIPDKDALRNALNSTPRLNKEQIRQFVQAAQ